jgi:hypothetical protein
LYIYTLFSLCIPIDRHLEWFHSFASVNSTCGCAAISIVCWLTFVQVYAQKCYSRIVQHFLRNFILVYIVNWLHQILFHQHPHQHLFLFIFLMITILTGVRWNLGVVLIWVFFMVKDVELFFMCLYVICTSFENCSLAHLLIEVFVWCLIFWPLYSFWIQMHFMKWKKPDTEGYTCMNPFHWHFGKWRSTGIKVKWMC